jgi:hypothetical protein
MIGYVEIRVYESTNESIQFVCGSIFLRVFLRGVSIRIVYK